MQYKAGDTNATNNAVMPQFNIVNSGTSSVDLSTLKIRYYFTKDATSAVLNFFCDYAQIGGSNIQGQFVTMATPTATADTYLEISFKAGSGTLAPGGQSGVIQTRFHKGDWSNFNEANDYSFDATKLNLTDWNHVALYQNGNLVYGVTP